MKHINSSDFIQDILTNNHSSVVLFYSKDQNPDSFSFIDILKEYSEKSTSESVFLYNMSEPKNEELALNFGVENTPTLLIFKNGSINRWLEPTNNKMNKQNVLKFLGNPIYYSVKKEDATNIVNTFSKKKIK